MKVVVAPDSFKGSATARDAAEAVAAGWRSVRPDDDIRCVPMADGGEGTVDACAAAHPQAVRHNVVVSGPDGRPTEAEWLEVPVEGTRSTAVVEFASGSGITLLNELQPLTAHSVGFGQLVRAAIESGCDRLLLGLGGSASTDGGLGVLTALGGRFWDSAGADPGQGNLALGRIAGGDLSRMYPVPAAGALVLSDVRNPLLGPRGAVAVFGKQKGIGPGEAVDAESRLASFAAIIEALRPVDPHAAGAGAAGGTGFALAAWGAEAGSGSEEIGRLLGLPRAIEEADVVITGEGRYDRQSRQGKVAGYVSDLAHAGAVPCLLVAGAIDRGVSPARDFAGWTSLAELAPSLRDAIENPLPWLLEAGRRLADPAALR